LFPWLAFPWLGFALSTMLFGTRTDKVSPTHLRRVLWLGLIGLVITSGLLLFTLFATSDSTWSERLRWSMFPPTPIYLLGTTSWTLFAFAIAYEWLDCRSPATRFPRFRGVVATFSRRSLTAYLLHHVVHLWPLWLWAVYQGLEATHYWRQATTVPMAVLLAGVFLLLCYFLFRWLDQTKRPSVEDLMRWLTD
jgi:hypothetical protein